MGLKCGIVGLPNVGKSTLFNLLTDAKAEASNYPFCTIEPNVGMVVVPDQRLEAIHRLVETEKVIPTTIEMVDIAGLVKGASQGEGLGNQFLANIREVDAIVHVVRCFDSDDIVHVNGQISPIDDIEVIETELALADLAMAERMYEKQKKLSKSGDKKALSLMNDLTDWIQQLSGDGLKKCPESLQSFGFLMAKPMLYVANVDESVDNSDRVKKMQDHAAKTNAQVLSLSIRLEGEIQQLPSEERAMFMEELGVSETGLARLVGACYHLLRLETFFTQGKQEIRAWTIRQGMRAPEAAGVIHTDFIKGFIRAEVIDFEQFVQLGGEQQAKEKGLYRLEGKDYVVKDGDIIFFRVNA
ncbi:MAG: redox-regulated ATPase YchF [Candidatus Comchoanobacterales bacterium]